LLAHRGELPGGPVDHADLSTPADAGQTDMFAEECDGICAT
jgi:hypothetical protein